MKTNLTTNSILRNSQIPTINISKETLKLIIDSLESEEVLTLFETLYGYLYENEEPSFKGKALTSVWNNLISTSERFSKSYFGRKAHMDKVNEEKKKTKQSAIQDTVGTEFDIPKPEIENKPILDTQIIQDDNQYQSDVESGLNSLKMDKNEVKQNTPIVEEKPVIKIAANKQFTPAERLQELINTDDDFYRIYKNCIKAVVDYKLSNGDAVKANKKEMAMAKLKELLQAYKIPYNTETKQFFMADVNFSISNINNEIDNVA